MNREQEISLEMAAAGFPKKVFRRKSKITIDLMDPETVRKMKFLKMMGILDSVGGHRRKAAKILGIHERTLYKWLKQLSN